MAPVSPKVLAQGSSEPPLEKGVIRLYGMRFCPFVHRVRLVLEAKNIPYETVNIHLKNKPDWYVARHPEGTGKVPLLQWDDKQLAESLVISDYLDEVYSESKLWPQDKYEKALGRMAVEQFSKIIGYMMKIIENNDPASYEGFQVTIGNLNKQLEQHNTTYLSGEKPGMADYMIWPFIESTKAYFECMSDKLQTFNRELVPHFVGWTKAMREDPIVKKCAVGHELYVEFLKSRATGNPNYDAGL